MPHHPPHPATFPPINDEPRTRPFRGDDRPCLVKRIDALLEIERDIERELDLLSQGLYAQRDRLKALSLRTCIPLG